jgi:diguanylate cyclase (GGDEF)-like protein
MPPKRRRKNDFEEPRPFWRAVPHYYLYPAIGLLIGLGSPVGAFLMRYWLADPLLKLLWIQHELQYNALFYSYMGIGTVTSFMIFGYVLGRRSEEQRVHNRFLSARVEDLHLKSVTDALTGAHTHGYLHEILELEVQRALTEKSSLSVLVLDIDDFKRVNDNHGHLFGDRVLRETAETIVANIRAEDILGRMGGDEFVVIMPATDAETAAQVAKRICTGISKNVSLATVSIGAATFSGDEKESVADLLQRADANLYQAKREGKNRVSAGEAAAD